MFKTLATAMLVSSTATQTCDYDALDFSAYTDEDCMEYDEYWSGLVRDMQSDHADKQTCECEYFGDDMGLSYISCCTGEGWFREYYNGDYCAPETLNTTDTYYWNDC